MTELTDSCDSSAAKPFAGRIAVITGGARGVGLATAQRVLAGGGGVALWDADAAALDRALRTLSAGERATATIVDVSDSAAVASARDEALLAHGALNILVNSAGIIGPTVPVVDVALDAWQRVLDIDLTGVFLCSKLLAPLMVDAGWGRIVNVSSLAGKEGTPNTAAYDAAKAGVIALTKAMGKELAQAGVLVNCIAPAALDTDMVAQADPAHVEIMLAKSPMARLGTAAECAALIAWLASDECSFSTGACFDLSGGRAVY